MMQVGSIPSLPPLGSVAGGVAKAIPADQSFGDLLKNFVNQTNVEQIQSDQAIRDLASGKTDNVQNVVLATAQAEMSFQLFMEIRNQLISSYNDLMRMQF